MFEKILIANRGEIACRIINTAKRMGIKTVAVFSEIDSQALHVQKADESVYIGPSLASESYLAPDAIIAACKETRAEAVHPGYGFLSENGSFCEELNENGIVFVGPDARAIREMGDKIKAKKIAKEAGIKTIPGYSEAIKNSDEVEAIAECIGYPVILKAAAGGGGRGMRVAKNSDRIKDGFERARSEAESNFGDGRIFIEKFIENPRHIEIQIIADSVGNIIYLGERECSIQRRHQKILEEAPSSFLDEKTRRLMGEAAVKLSKVVGYRGAGTVEFVVDSSRNFFFLEMNTRIQVEHPVTELVTGTDIVEMMIRVAAGESLMLKQRDVQIKGHAIEVRICAEDPKRNFLPSTGRLISYRPPQLRKKNIRFDTGVSEGAEISIFYDSMIGKLITHGGNRDSAIDTMCHALDNFVIAGVETNRLFLSRLIRHPRFRKNQVSTNFFEEEYPDGIKPLKPSKRAIQNIGMVSAFVHQKYCERNSEISGQIACAKPENSSEWVVILDKKQHSVGIEMLGCGFNASSGPVKKDFETNWKIGDSLFHAVVDGVTVYMHIERKGIGYKVLYAGGDYEILVLNPRHAFLNGWMLAKSPQDTAKHLHSPMPGLLTEVCVDSGVFVKAGDKLCIIEAMKMENVLTAERDLIVENVEVKPGQSLSVDQIILTFR